MSVFKRANWHSGLTYSQSCPECKTIVKYDDHSLGFRPWYPDGFVYCPKCQKPLRHNEDYAINKDESRVVEVIDLTKNEIINCPSCGGTTTKKSNFCGKCGAKLEK